VHHVSFVLAKFSMLRSVFDMSPSLCNPCHVGRDHSNLIVESWDEILFKGGRL
jgi:hypothetical protein